MPLLTTATGRMENIERLLISRKLIEFVGSAWNVKLLSADYKGFLIKSYSDLIQ